ncbi:MAG: hypothetical protein AAF922_14100 [Pseudomonadota bacterium]
MIATTSQTILAIESLLALPFLIMGLSHILQPHMWLDMFQRLAAKGNVGVLERSFLFELWPASLIVAFHQDWRWPGVLLTIYGHTLAAKIAISLAFPLFGLRSLRMAQEYGQTAFIPAGAILSALGLFCFARGFGFWV